MSNKTFSVEHGAFIDNEVDIHGATPLLKLTDTDTSNLQHTLSSSAGLVLSADANNVEASTTIDFAVDGSTVGTLGPTGNLTLTSDSSPILSLTDTTNTVTASVYAQDSNVFYGSTTNHATNIGSNNITAIAIDTSQNVTVSGTINSEEITVTTDTEPKILVVPSSSSGSDATIEIRAARNNPSAGVEAAALLLSTYDSDIPEIKELAKITSRTVVGSDTNLNSQKLTFQHRVSGSLSEGMYLYNNDLIVPNGNVGINESSPTTGKLVVNADNNTYAIRAEGGATAGQSYGMRIRAGSNASDRALLVENKAADTTFMEILGDGSVNINGNLTVTGTTTSIDNTNTQVADQLMELGNGRTGAAAGDAGLIIERGDDANAFIGFDESADQFVVATTTATGASTGDLTLTDGNFRANQITTSYTNNASGVMRNIYESTSAPTSGDGQVGDVWIVYA